MYTYLMHWIKPIFDILIASTMVVILLPILAVISLVLLIKQGPPILFSQPRPGLKETRFLLYKFRSMKPVDEMLHDKINDGERLTALGKFLRKYSLDELPELWNVIKGDMSLVGPRPLLIEYLNLYSPEQARRHEIKPGITGWAQVNGRNAITWEEKFNLDLWYVDNLSFWLDLKIIAMTVWKIIKREGINQPGQATMEKFQGTGEM